MEKCSSIMAIAQERRTESATRVQDVLTRYGCNIKVRLGLHDVQPDGGVCSNTGMIMLQLVGPAAEITQLEKDLQAIPNVKVKQMMLDF